MSTSATVVERIARDDAMFTGDARQYLELGRQALELIQAALDHEPATILDLPCGHGRVLRWLVAAYPDARITACDIDRAGVDFCAQTFGAVPVYGSEDPGMLQLGGPFELIWVGSLFTHLPADRWRAFLRVFESHLAPHGRLIFTTAGVAVVKRMREGETLGITPQAVARVVDDFERQGFGFAEYQPGSRYGLARASEDWVRAEVARASLALLSYESCGWNERQDVIVATR